MHSPVFPLTESSLRPARGGRLRDEEERSHQPLVMIAAGATGTGGGALPLPRQPVRLSAATAVIAIYLVIFQSHLVIVQRPLLLIALGRAVWAILTPRAVVVAGERGRWASSKPGALVCPRVQCIGMISRRTLPGG